MAHFLSASMFSVLLAALALPITGTRASEAEQRFAVSVALATGRAPNADEVARSLVESSGTVAGYLARFRDRLKKEHDEARAAAERAWLDAFGLLSPPVDGSSLRGADRILYYERLLQHTQWLRQHPDEYSKVVDRAYEAAMHRKAFPVEQDYWKQRASLPFILLVGCVENWAQRNAPGLMATTGTPAIHPNSALLDVVVLMPGVAGEARAGSGLAPDGDAAIAVALGRTIVAPGAGAVTSVGSIHFVATSSAGLRARLARLED